MIKVKVNKNIIVITGHANYADYGKDIVCAACSSIVITSVNACLRIEEQSLEQKQEKNKLTIKVLSNNKAILLIIENMLAMLKELALTYKENIKIEEEERS